MRECKKLSSIEHTEKSLAGAGPRFVSLSFVLSTQSSINLLSVFKRSDG